MVHGFQRTDAELHLKELQRVTAEPARRPNEAAGFVMRLRPRKQTVDLQRKKNCVRALNCGITCVAYLSWVALARRLNSSFREPYVL